MDKENRRYGLGKFVKEYEIRKTKRNSFARMKNYCKKVNAPKYKLDINNKYFGMEFYKSMDYLKRTDLNVPVNVLLNVPVNNRQNELLELLSSAKFTINKLSVKLNVADKTIKRDLKKLIDLKFVERIGSDKSGYYWIKIKAEK